MRRRQWEGSGLRAYARGGSGSPTCAGYRARTRTGAASGWESGASLGLRCCASDRGEGRLSWWRGGLGLGSTSDGRGAGWGEGEGGWGCGASECNGRERGSRGAGWGDGEKATVGDAITSFELPADGHRAGISHDRHDARRWASLRQPRGTATEARRPEMPPTRCRLGWRRR